MTDDKMPNDNKQQTTNNDTNNVLGGTHEEFTFRAMSKTRMCDLQVSLQCVAQSEEGELPEVRRNEGFEHDVNTDEFPPALH